MERVVRYGLALGRDEGLGGGAFGGCGFRVDICRIPGGLATLVSGVRGARAHAERQIEAEEGTEQVVGLARTQDGTEYRRGSRDHGRRGKNSHGKDS